MISPAIRRGGSISPTPTRRSVKTPRGFIQGYNAHAVATADQIIIATELTNRTADGGMLAPMVMRTRSQQLAGAGIEQAVEVVLADAGYWMRVTTSDQLTSQRNDRPGSARRTLPAASPTANLRGGLADQMRHELAADEGRELYRRRQAMIEPVFGNTKHNRRIDHFRRRGLGHCLAEWRLIATTHNLLKLWKATPATA